MSSPQRWALPDYAQPTYRSGVGVGAGVGVGVGVGIGVGAGAAAVIAAPARPAHPVVLHRSPRGLNRASAQLVYLLVLVTSVIALVDLYLLSTAIPR